MVINIRDHADHASPVDGLRAQPRRAHRRRRNPGGPVLTDRSGLDLHPRTLGGWTSRRGTAGRGNGVDRAVAGPAIGACLCRLTLSCRRGFGGFSIGGWGGGGWPGGGGGV